MTFIKARDTLWAMSNAIEFLLRAQNPDGGWGYRVGGMSYVEPTAAVLRVLTDSTARARGRDFLLALQRADGGWGIAARDTESGWMTAWAVYALADFSEARDAVARGVQWLLTTEGQRLTDPSARQTIQTLFRIDSALTGWPWQRGDAAWVHPTSLALLALVAAGVRDHARVREGIAYLFDRACPDGGWNVGNPWMLDKKIPATIQDTAMVLLALRALGVASGEWRVASAIQYLRRALDQARTSAELAWGIWAMRAWRLEIRDLEIRDWAARLNALQHADGSWEGNPFITAIASGGV
ncbi:MAG: terpene cyclase/mutase family protein [Anaerolineae bacterium]|nr:terpene cyclase/mutase family protein [Anaerolineae bacterium]